MPLSKKAFGEAMAILGTYYDKIEATLGDTIKTKAWYSALQDMEDDELRAAVNDYAKTGKFAPMPADLWDRVRTMREAQNPQLTAEEAWGILYRDISRLGYYAEPTYDDCRLEAAKNSIGWSTLCGLTDNTLMPTRAHFLRIFASFAQREKTALQTDSPKAVEFVNRLAQELTGKSAVPVKELEKR